MPNLFSPLKIKAVQLKNRIATSPMCQYSSDDGFASDWHLVHLGTRAVGGSALVITEAAAVSPEGRISPQDLGIWKDEHIDMLQRINRFIKQQDSVSGIQLAHAGRKASHSQPWTGGQQLATSQGGWATVAPSPLAFTDKEQPPAELSVQEIGKVVEDFKAATSRSREAGFSVVEIHAAHGYLIHEFLSPLSNRRTDDYGGSFENRTRLLLQIVAAVQEEWPEDYPLFVRISATDWTEGGWTIDDSVALTKLLQHQGVDLIDCSTGGNVSNASIPAAPNYQVPFAEIVKQKTGILTGAVGIIVTAPQAEEIITTGKADLVLLARELLRDPYFPLKAAGILGQQTTWPVQYERAKR